MPGAKKMMSIEDGKSKWLDIPHVILMQILFFLNIADRSRLQGTCKFFKEFIAKNDQVDVVDKVVVKLCPTRYEIHEVKNHARNQFTVTGREFDDVLTHLVGFLNKPSLEINEFHVVSLINFHYDRELKDLKDQLLSTENFIQATTVKYITDIFSRKFDGILEAFDSRVLDNFLVELETPSIPDVTALNRICRLEQFQQLERFEFDSVVPYHEKIWSLPYVKFGFDTTKKGYVSDFVQTALDRFRRQNIRMKKCVMFYLTLREDQRIDHIQEFILKVLPKSDHKTKASIPSNVRLYTDQTDNNRVIIVEVKPKSIRFTTL